MKESLPHTFCLTYQPKLWASREILKYRVSTPLVSAQLLYEFEKGPEETAKIKADIQIKIPIRGPMRFLAETTCMSQPSRVFSAFETYTEQDGSTAWTRRSYPAEKVFVVETTEKNGRSGRREVSTVELGPGRVLNPLMIPIIFRGVDWRAVKQRASLKLAVLASHQIYDVDLEWLWPSSSTISPASAQTEIAGIFSCRPAEAETSVGDKRGKFVWDLEKMALILLETKLPWFGSVRLELVSCNTEIGIA